MKPQTPYLNKEQIQATKYYKGPLLIVAGAGTGKTSVIVEKIQYLITSKKILPQQILALTFTEKAASEMEERVDQRIPYGYFQMWISTFHAFAEHILKEYGTDMGFSSQFRLMTEAESILFIKKNLFLFSLKYFRPLSNPEKFIEALLTHFSRLRDENISPDEYSQWIIRKSQNENKLENDVEIEKYKELAHAYTIYESLKIKNTVYDFSDLMYYALKLLQSRPHILKQYQKTFTDVFVDEFQDTNIAQYEFIKLLCPPKNKPHLTVVGDDSQSIYKFRGASISNILSFMKDYPQAKQITLIKNYRSNQEILNSAYRLIQNNNPDTLESKLGISKKLQSENQQSVSINPIQIYISDTMLQEYEIIAKQIQNFIAENRSFSDIAILARAHNHLESLTRTLTQYAIPYQFYGPSQLFKQPEIKDLIAYLNVLSNPDDSISFYRVLSMKLFQINNVDISRLLTFSKSINQSLFQSLEIYQSCVHQEFHIPEYDNYKPYIPLISKKTKEQIVSLISLIRTHIALVKKDTAGQILYYFLENTGYLKQIVEFSTEHDEIIAHNISKFFNILKSFETRHEDSSIHAVVEYLAMCITLGDSPVSEIIDSQSKNAVHLLTVHAAKGLEFPIVFIINLVQGRFPSRTRKEQIPIPEELIKEILPSGDFHIQEERRLYYVAMTRAKQKLILTAAKHYGEGIRMQKLSPFLFESCGVEVINMLEIKNSDEKKQLSMFDYSPKKSLKIRDVTNNLYRSQDFQLSISYSQLESFSLCPLQYKYHYILGIPTFQTASLSFGTSVHQALQYFYSQFIKDQNVSFQILKDYYQKTWIPIGYSSLSHEKKMKEQGLSMLKNYYTKFHTQQPHIFEVEKKFRLKLSPHITLKGKIDRIDQIKLKKYEIIDYKTGKKPNEKELNESLQMSIYALALTDKKLYNFSLKNLQFTYYYLATQEKITIVKTDHDLKKAKNFILETVANIRSSSYSPKTGKWCDHCPFRMICEAWR